MKNFRLLVLFLGFGHGLNDLIAGYFLGLLVQMKMDLLQISTGLLLYNLLAFGGQYFIALLIEKAGTSKKFLLISYGLNVTALAFFFYSPQLSIVLAGIASAIYHVAGGSVCAQKNKAFNIGLFAAPGVAGLIAGGYFAFEKFHITGWLLAIAAIFFILLILIRIRNTAAIRKDETINNKFSFDQHDLVMILLLTVISLRSVIWDIFQLIHENNYDWLLAIGAAAFAGKIFGGWLADKIGWRLYTYSALSIATPLITFFKNELILFCIGIGLLQSVIPPTTSLLIHSLKGKTERGISLSFGATIMFGAIIFYTPLRTILYSDYSILIIVAAMLLIFFISEEKILLFSHK